MAKIAVLKNGTLLLYRKLRVYRDYIRRKPVTAFIYVIRCNATLNKDNICLILTCKDGYTEDDIKAFDKLNYKNKVVFVPKKYNNFDSSFYIKNSEENSEIKFLGTKINHFGKKIIDDFDIVSFLNKCKE